MKLDAPITVNGFACILEDGTLCFGEMEADCSLCDYRKENECVPVMIEVVPAEEWAERKLSRANSHAAFQDTLTSLESQFADLKDSLEKIKL
jgi:hypothetical protein